MAMRFWALLVLAGAAVAQEKAPGYLGVRIGPSQRGDGVVILDATPDAPAAKAGIKPGDVLVQFGGAPVKTPDELIALVRARAAGEEASYVLLRGEGRIEGKVRLAASPPAAPPAPPLGERLDRRDLPVALGLGARRGRVEAVGLGEQDAPVGQVHVDDLTHGAPRNGSPSTPSTGPRCSARSAPRGSG